MLERILGPLARRWAWVAVALRVQERFGSVKGSYLAAAITLNIFTSLFPALLIAVAVLGFFTSSDDTTKEIIETLGVTGTNADTVENILEKAAEGKNVTSIVGFLGLAWSGLGLVAAIEYALDATWQHTGRGIKDKLRGILWGAGALTIILASIALTAVVDIFAAGVVLTVLSITGAIAVNIGLWLFTFVVLSYQKLPWRAYLPGAILGGVGLEIIKQLTSTFGKYLAGSSLLYGSIGIAFTIITALALIGRLLIYSSILNVIRWETEYGTVTVDIEVPKVPGEVPTETDRAGAVEPN